MYLPFVWGFLFVFVVSKLIEVVIHQNERLSIERDGNEEPGDRRNR